jgi:hypothetical protein
VKRAALFYFIYKITALVAYYLKKILQFQASKSRKTAW